MTIEEKIAATQEKRGIGLNGIKSALAAKVQSEEERDLNNRFLFGDPGEYGIMDVFTSYYIQAYSLNGFDTTLPSLKNGSDSDWTNRFSSCVAPQGDDATGFYPPDENGVGAQELNVNSLWFSTNGQNDEYNQGVIGNSTAIQAAIDALQYQRESVYADPPDNTILLHPDYFNDPERANLLSSIQSVITDLTSAKTYIQNTIDMLNSIDGGSSTVFEELPDMKTDLPLSDITTMTTLLTTIDGFISTYQGHYDYFNQFPASDDISGESGYSQSEFNTRYKTTLPGEMAALQSAFQTRVGEIITALGATASPFSGLRSWRYFWIAENIGKPLSPYFSLSGLDSALSQAQNALALADSSLSTLFGTTEEYIVTPTLITSYFQPKFNLTTLLLESSKIITLWIGAPYANKYKVFRKVIADVTLDNDNWTDTYLLSWVYEVDSESGFIKIQYDDTSHTLDTGYVYRVQTFDTSDGPAGEDRIDSFNSSSIQSKVFDLDSTITIDAVTEIKDALNVTVSLQLTLSEEIGVNAGSYIALLDGASAGLYKVLNVTQDVDVTIDYTDPTGFLGSTVSMVYGSRFAAVL